MRKLLHRFSHAFAFCLVAVSCGVDEKQAPAPAEIRTSVWEVTKDGHRIYVTGTIHLLREQDHPLPSPFETAYQNSEKLLFELPPGSESDGQTVSLMQRLGTYPPGEELKQFVSESLYARTLKWAAEKGLPEESVARMRPWFVALTIAATEYQGLGADPSRGVDTYFEKRAKKDGKTGEGLETVALQLNIFAGLSPKLQEQMLEQTFTESETLPKDFQDLITAWRTGDAAKLQEFLFRDADKYPELLEEFLLKRNKAWIEPLLRCIAKREKVMVLV